MYPWKAAGWVRRLSCSPVIARFINVTGYALAKLSQ